MRQLPWDVLWYNARIMTCVDDISLLHPAAVAVKDQSIVWVGYMSELEGEPSALANQTFDVRGKLLTPGLVDCHTHLIYAGTRAEEFAARLKGKSYEDISREGGGINKTVRDTREVSEDELYAASLPRAIALLTSGVTTLEIKSGYGLNVETEMKILRVAKRLEENLPLTIFKTFLGAHTIPLEYKNEPDRYVDIVCNEMIPEVAEQKLADSVDVFCENIAFSLPQCERIFATAAQYHLSIKCHAEQLSSSGAASLAARYKALSVDHLEYAGKADVIALKKSDSVAVLLPGAFYFLRETKLPPMALLREHNVPIAIASDCNPGTSPFCSLPLIMQMACTLFRLTVQESWLAVTQNSAKSLSKSPTFGTIEIGKAADFVIWKNEDPLELCYYAGLPLLDAVIKNGIPISH